VVKKFDEAGLEVGERIITNIPNPVAMTEEAGSA
jgi:hypothetical protein